MKTKTTMKMMEPGYMPITGLFVFCQKKTREISWIWLFITALSPEYYQYAKAQSYSNKPPVYGNAKFSLGFGIVILVLVACAFVLFGIFSIYLRICGEPRDSPADDRSGSTGLDQKAIEAFPILEYGKVKDLRIWKEVLECAVCLSEFEDAEALRLLPTCSHVFHSNCIDSWLATHVTCPVCREDLTLEAKPAESNVNPVSISIIDDLEDSASDSTTKTKDTGKVSEITLNGALADSTRSDHGEVPPEAGGGGEEADDWKRREFEALRELQCRYDKSRELEGRFSNR